MSEEKKKEEKGKEEEKIDSSVEQIRKTVTTEYREFLDFLKKPFRLIWVNFLIGLARGLGIAIGMTILAAIITYILILVLSKMVDLPIIGEWVAKVVGTVRDSLDKVK